MAAYKPLEDRLRDGYVRDLNTGCWVWWRGKDSWGYGQIGIQRGGKTKQLQAHRVSFELNVGTIPHGLELDHLCRNPACVNPAHLEPVTTRVNILRGFGPPAVNARKTHCIRGHEFNDENTGHSQGKRFCLTCRRKQDREAKAEKRGQHAFGQ